MNHPIPLKKTAPPFLILLRARLLWTFAKSAAVVPPPDGGYPGGNTAEGASALFSLTTGSYNTAVGFFSLRSKLSAASTLPLALARSFSMPEPTPIPQRQIRPPAPWRF